ncbi:hypothetical protein LXL04_001237 [Taraxacum kok-saghyz]
MATGTPKGWVAWHTSLPGVRVAPRLGQSGRPKDGSGGFLVRGHFWYLEDNSLNNISNSLAQSLCESSAEFKCNFERLLEGFGFSDAKKKEFALEEHVTRMEPGSPAPKVHNNTNSTSHKFTSSSLKV